MQAFSYSKSKCAKVSNVHHKKPHLPNVNDAIKSYQTVYYESIHIISKTKQKSIKNYMNSGKKTPAFQLISCFERHRDQKIRVQSGKPGAYKIDSPNTVSISGPINIGIMYSILLTPANSLTVISLTS